MERRRLLRGVGALCATTIAGCSSLSDGTGGDIGELGEWAIPLPDDHEQYSYGVHELSLDRLREIRHASLEETTLGQLDWARRLGLDDAVLRRFETQLWISSNAGDDHRNFVVYQGDVDRDEVVEAIGRPEHADAGTLGSYEIMPTDAGPWMAVQDGTIVANRSGLRRSPLTPNPETVRDAVRTSTGDLESHFDRVDAFLSFAEAVPRGAERLLSEYRNVPAENLPDALTELDGIVFMGESRDREGSSSVRREYYQFETAGAVETTPFDAYVETESQESDGSVEYDVDGTTVEVTKRYPVE